MLGGRCHARGVSSTWDWQDHLEVVERSAGNLGTWAEDAGLDAPVPTCPRWTVADLVAHQGIVHRWAASNVRGQGPVSVPKEQVLREVPADRLLDWFADGTQGLVDALRAAPEDLSAMVFLKDAPPPKRFWARRQAHETTIHSMDALAARLRRVPRADETGVPAELALDGIDELLCGFVTRGRSKLSRQDGTSLLVAPTGADRSWVLHLDERIVTEVGAGLSRGGEDPHHERFRGTAQELYLGLWNRGAEIVSTDPDLLRDWHGRQRVRWS
jgi:uncharacterized protein (TIGR03083 family)